ncbi:hypothetical protein LPJ66_008352 [Kickxella alabastrina]|uniref:Uncharacterized protein n=1 Tax=Kickxella alabastrina TaxID=61397 RepID=A0ACC1I9X6_9FUNG|nr:hypothetical protein LPJ66_008352 [Kickxella alabastrina]
MSTPFRTPTRYQQPPSAPSPSSPATHQPAAQGSAATPRGKWFNPEAQRLLNEQASHQSERQSTLRLRWNVAILVVAAWISHTGIYHHVKSYGQATGITPAFVWFFVEWTSLGLLVYNIGDAVWCLLQPKKQYTSLAMTPSQRLRMGLDSRAVSTAKRPPIAAPCMTPSKVSTKTHTPARVTDIEIRRNTPSRGTAPLMATPHALRSPLSLSVNSVHADYSTASDFLTLTQVLKKVPGINAATAAAENAQGTPSQTRPSAGLSLTNPLMSSSLAGSNLATPRLPVGRYGFNDIMAITPQQHLRPQLTIGLYQTATPVSRRTGGEGMKGTNKERAAGEVDYQEPHEVLEKYGVERDIFDWVENMHSWFVRHLLRPLCKQIDELDHLFEQNGLGHLSCRRAVLDTQALEQAKASAMPTGLGQFGSGFGTSALGGGFGGGFGATNYSTTNQPAQQTIPQNLVELSLKYADLPQTKERMALEKYLLIPGFNCREYIVQRVHTLSQSGALPAYKFDGGGNYVAGANAATATVGSAPAGDTQAPREQPWNQAQHPTDAQLLFHLFCTFMDQTMPPVQNTRYPFTDRFVLQPDCKPDHNLPAQIIQVVRKRPHFCLFVKGSFYDVTAGRNNLFIVLILFVLEIQRECAGYLGLTNLGGKQVDLLSVISK